MPLYQLPLQLDADSIGFYLRTDSLSADIEPYFNETDPGAVRPLQREVRVAADRRASRPCRDNDRRTTRRLHALTRSRRAATSRSSTRPSRSTANRTNMAAVIDAVSLVARGRAAAPPARGVRRAARRRRRRSSDAAPYTGPPGRVDWSNVSLDDGRFTGQVHATRPAWVMLKESYSPHWTRRSTASRCKTADARPELRRRPGSGRHAPRRVQVPPAVVVSGLLFALGVRRPARASRSDRAAWRRYRHRGKCDSATTRG